MLKGLIDEEIAAAVRAIDRPDWVTSVAAIETYRVALLAAQDQRCVYCSRRIRDEVGHRELEHVLPKSQSPAEKFDEARAASNEWSHRRHTRGYRLFQYEPENLALACKRCNIFKGTFDPLANRTVAPTAMPTISGAYEWVHPHYDKWHAHIRILDGLIYEPVSQSPKGNAVIKACGLDRAEQITARQVEACLTSNRAMLDEMLDLVFRGNPFDCATIAEALHARYQVTDAETIEHCLDDLTSTYAKGSTALVAALQRVSQSMGTGDPILPPKSEDDEAKVLTNRPRRLTLRRARST